MNLPIRRGNVSSSVWPRSMRDSRHTARLTLAHILPATGFCSGGALGRPSARLQERFLLERLLFVLGAVVGLTAIRDEQLFHWWDGWNAQPVFVL